MDTMERLPADGGDIDVSPNPEQRDPMRFAIAAIASAAAAVLHAAAAGIHADHPTLSRLFVALAVAQGAAAILGFVRADRVAGWLLVSVNLVAVAGWIATRLTGFEAIGGLEVAERPQLADSISAILAAVAVAGAVAAWSPRARALPARAITNAAIIAGILVVPGLADATTHDHAGHTDGSVAADGHDHGDGTGVAAVSGDTTATADDGHAHTDGIQSNGDIDGALGSLLADQVGTAATADDGHAHDLEWPRAWDPTTDPIDFSGVEGVSAEQQARAELLVRDTLRDLPQFADVTSVGQFGYQSIGDASTGFEHYVNYSLINDDVFLDPTQPESLVYRVDGDQRMLVSAMFIAGNRPVDDPELTDFGGPLMQWHVHDNLCWGLDENSQPKVLAVLENPGDTCPALTVNAGAENPMVHVWITAHECGPFAALEGHGAGQTAAAEGDRVDQCAHAHPDGTSADTTAATATTPYDPAKPIDLSGTPGVTAEQQAFAENLVAATLRDLPQWSDPAVATAAGFRSIGDGSTGHEHYVNWAWIDDDVFLDPDFPESLVYEPQADGSKRLVSAMFMLPMDSTLDDVPDYGGALMQWHVHGDLCFSEDPATRVVTGTKPVDGSCRAPFVEVLSPMIHVWITPHQCGPFAALEGIAGGQVPEGETVLCDHAHGSG
jgi:hypothetical protein